MCIIYIFVQFLHNSICFCLINVSKIDVFQMCDMFIFNNIIPSEMFNTFAIHYFTLLIKSGTCIFQSNRIQHYHTIKQTTNFTHCIIQETITLIW